MDALQSYLDEVRTKPFSWGEHDCAIFVASCIDAQLGTDYLKQIHTLFKIEKGPRFARRARRYNLESGVTHFLGASVPVEELRYGAVVLINNDSGSATYPSLGIYTKPIALSPGELGLTAVATTRIIKGWNVCPRP
jgi:hypothetical protein